jgi:D-aspartate ligase
VIGDKVMDFKGTRVLILEGYARQCLPFMESFKKHGCEVTVLCNSRLDLAYASRFSDHKIIGICDPKKYKESETYICGLVKTGDYDLVVPLVDFSARILSANKAELSKYAHIASNDFDVFDKAQDKLEVMQVCMENQIPCPRTLLAVNSFQDIIDAQLIFPVVIKPRRGFGARGFHCFHSEQEIVTFAEKKEISQCVIQEYIPQGNMNLSANLFIDNNGLVKSTFVYASRRWFPLNGGTGTFNELVDRPDVEKACRKLASLMKLRGCIGIDLIHDPRDGIAKVIEINPRILACAKIGFAAGIDLAEQILQKEFGQEVSFYADYDKKIRIRMSQTDALWFLKSPNRFKVEPSFFSCRNVKDQIFSWDDPLPWFFYSIQAVFRYKSEIKKR